MTFPRRLSTAVPVAAVCAAMTCAPAGLAAGTETETETVTTSESTTFAPPLSTTETTTVTTITTSTETATETATETSTTETTTITTLEPLSLPPLQGPQFRYPNANIFERIVLDSVAIPASVVGWSAADWAGFSAVGVPVVALMLPYNPSLDVSFQDWINRNRTETADTLLQKVKTPVISLFTLGYIGVFWGVGWLSENDTILELASITSEALTIGQFYHVTLKVLIGREAPDQRDGLGIVHGPTFEFFPGGTPSGHLVTTSVLVGVWGEYFDSWILRGAGYAITGYVAAASVYGNAHYLSDVIWGIGIGYGVTSWVVRNRSTQYRYAGDGAREWVGFAPLTLPGVTGAQVVGTW